jgi:hypothetical protein
VKFARGYNYGFDEWKCEDQTWRENGKSGEDLSEIFEIFEANCSLQSMQSKKFGFIRCSLMYLIRLSTGLKCNE